MSLYFNNAFAKQPLAQVASIMQPYLRDKFENPLTESDDAEDCRRQVESGREAVAALLESKPGEIYFVSSGTEANNWALKGAATAHQKRKNHIIISAIEHFSVFQTAQFLQRQGFDLTIVPVTPEGFVDPHDVEKTIRPTTVLVSIQAASDEIGAIQNLREIIELKKRHDDVLFHTDAVQFLCYEMLSVSRHPFDLVSLSSNALYGPPGIGALYVREGARIQPLLHGGMQEEGMRPGLQSTALIAGFGEAARTGIAQKGNWKQQLAAIQQRIFESVSGWGLSVTGSKNCRLVDNIHVLADVDGEALLTLLLSEGIKSSSGSTCYQYAQKESHVLSALGVSREETQGAVLFTTGIDQTQEDIDILVEATGRMLAHLRRIKA